MAKPVDPMIKLLKQVKLFEGLTTKELEVLRGIARDHTFGAGAAIVTQGDKDRRLYLIADGEAKISVDGKSVGKVGSGDYFGEIAVLDGGERAATVIATTSMTVLSISYFNLRPLLKEQPELGIKLLVGMCAMVRGNATRKAGQTH